MRSASSGGHAAATVLDREADPVRVVGIGPGDNNDAAAFGEFDRVAGKIDQHLAKPRRVDHDGGRQGRIDLGGKVQPLGVGAAEQQLGDALQRRLQRRRPWREIEAAGLDAGEIEHVVDEAEHQLAGIADGAGKGLLLRRQLGVEEDVGEAENARRAASSAHG